MKATLLPERGVVKVAGEPARAFLNGLVTADVGEMTPQTPRFAALLTPQGKIIADFIVAQAPAEDGGDFFLDCPRALAGTLVEKLNFYKLRAKIVIEDLSETLGVMAVWDGAGDTEYGLVYPDPRLPALGLRIMLPPHLADKSAADLGAALVDPNDYDTHRIALGVPRGGLDFIYGETFPHDADMDQLHGVDFKKGCFVGQEVVSRVEHRGTARNRIVPVAFEDFAAEAGIAVMAGEKSVGMMGSSSGNLGLAMLRLDRIDDALAAGAALTAGGLTLRLRESAFAQFTLPGAEKAAS
jgi:folate-binding protein YgfZ